MDENRVLYLSRADVKAVGLSMAEIIDVLEDAFREKGEGRVEMPPKPGIHPGEGDNFIHAMPAYIPALKSSGRQVGERLPGELQAGSALHQRPAHPQRRRDRPAYLGDGLCLDHGHAHRRGDCGGGPPSCSPRVRLPSACWGAESRGAPTWRR